MRLAVRSALSAKDAPCRSSTVNRQMSTDAEASSMTLSIPKASSEMLPAWTPLQIATAASITIQQTVTCSSRKARRTSAARRGSSAGRWDAVEQHAARLAGVVSGCLRAAWSNRRDD